MSDTYAGPQCYIQIYPHEGGVYAIESGQVISCNTSKYIKGGEGSFQIILAPGGPNGPNVGPSWLDIITPMSFVMIGMSRGKYKQIVMLGVVTRMSEAWSFDREQVTRVTRVVGADIGYFFTHFSWYALSYINGPAALLSSALGQPAAGGSMGTQAGLGGQLNSGPPDQLGAAWYKNVMDGGDGVLSRTWFQYGANNQVLFSDSVTVKFEKYLDNLTVPFSFSFIPEETWIQKFMKIFPYPWYEFFIITAPDGFYDTALSTSWNDVVGGQSFTMTKLGADAAARIYVIARVNPLPSLSTTADGTTLTFGDIKTDAFNKLKTFPEGVRFISTTEEFCEEEVRNFYIVNPTFFRSMLGQANDAVIPPVLGGAVAVDPASIHRYGFRPAYMETEWFADQEGQTAASQKVDFPQAYGNLLGRLAAQYEPVSMMMRAVRKGPLRPDIIPGNLYTYQPLKDKVSSDWTFYIEGVDHSYMFGGPSTTTLTLSRGLPTDVYGNTGLLTAIHKGNAQRANGVYQTGLPSGPKGAEEGLQGVSLLSDDIQKLLAKIAPIYSTPQGDQVNPPPT